MNREEQEKLRHEVYAEELKSATTVSELPKRIAPSSILSTLTSLACFKNEKIEKEKLEFLIDPLLSDVPYLISSDFNNKLKEVFKENYKEKTDEEINNKIREIMSSRRLFNLISESNAYDRKYSELYKKETAEKHNKIIAKINSTRMIEDLPKIGIGNVNHRIQIDLYELFKKEKLKVEFTGDISKALLEGKNINDLVIQNAIKKICESRPMIDSYNSMSIDEKIEYVSNILEIDYELKYLIEEVNAREKRIGVIYKLDHDDTMDQIKDARRISQMPPNLAISRITKYLAGNTTIFGNERLTGGEFNTIAQFLINGKKMEDDEIKSEIRRIADTYFEDNKDEAYKLLNEKLSKLPRLYYYVDEVKYGLERQKEFIKNGASNVNVYFIPNPKSPVEGGKFYNCYINRASNLNLEEVLPLDLEEIIPPETEIDAVEWYVQEHADPTFKAAGGIILNKDESIGGVNVFRPNDGKVGITPEEKSKYEKLEELSKKLKEITDISKKSKEEFMKFQEAYLKSQAVIDEQIATIQEAMNVLIEDKGKGLK